MIYQLIRQESFSDFNLAVNNFLKDDWELIGETKILIEPDKTTKENKIVYYQTVVKK